MKQFVLLILIFPFLCFSQDQQPYALDLTAGYYTNFKSWKESGVSGGVEVSYLKNDFVYGGGFFYGFGFSTNQDTKNGYLQAQLELDFLFGKKYRLTPHISVIPQVGIGYIHLTNHFQEDPQSAFGLPIQVKLYLYERKRFAFGLISRAKLNKNQNIFSANITLQFKL